MEEKTYENKNLDVLNTFNFQESRSA